MRCPYCGNPDTQVKDSRPSEDNTAIRRRRVCDACGGRFTTFERVQLRELMVVKKNGRRVPSEKIGLLVMDGLKGLDEVAYVRFASVYRNFNDTEDFKEVLGELSGDAM